MCSKVLNGHIILTDTSITTILAPEMTYTPKLLTDNGIRISMTEKGDPYENAVAERVNGILKSDWIDEDCFESFQAAKERIDQIVILYNSLRPHASCDWLTPLEAELRTGKLKHHWGRKTVVRKAYVNLYQDNIF